MNKLSYSVVLRKDSLNAKGKMSVYLQVFVNKERDYIPLSLQVKPAHWSESRQGCNSKDKDADLNNEIIDIAVTKAKEIHRDANKYGQQLTKKSFREKFYLLFGNNFTDYFINQVELRYADGIISKATRKTHRSLAMKFRQFSRTCEISDINTSLLEKYEAYLIRIGNNVNSRRTSMKVLHTYILLVIKEAKIVIQDPFDDYDIPSEEDTREALESAELKLLLECYDRNLIPDNLRPSLLFFLLSCFTGMRLGDVKLFGKQMVKEERLIYKPSKTAKKEKWVRIEMSKVAKRIVYDALDFIAEGGKMYCDATINRHLKIIASELKINPDLHFHMGRHTFATTFIRMGGSVEVLQRILCHSKIETTMRYVHMIDDRVDKEMKLFDLSYQ